MATTDTDDQSKRGSKRNRMRLTRIRPKSGCVGLISAFCSVPFSDCGRWIEETIRTQEPFDATHRSPTRRSDRGDGVLRQRGGARSSSRIPTSCGTSAMIMVNGTVISSRSTRCPKNSICASAALVDAHASRVPGLDHRVPNRKGPSPLRGAFAYFVGQTRYNRIAPNRSRRTDADRSPLRPLVRRFRFAATRSALHRQRRGLSAQATSRFPPPSRKAPCRARGCERAG
jgi:hypothetical protein